MSYISDIVKFVKGGKASFVKKMKLYFYIAIGISIYILVFGIILLITHGIIMFTKNVPVIHSCPYNYSSYGLNAETSFPIIGTVVDTVVGIVYSNKRDPATCQKTCEKRCTSSEETTCLENCKYDCRYNGVKGGVLNGYRDSILNNLNFQIIRTILVVFVISILGVTFLFGFTPMRASELLKKLAILGLFLFATDSRSYVLYDQFLEPLVLEGSKQLSGMINGILLATMDSPELIAYSNAHPNNEFIVLDASISIFFSQAIFDKMGALTFTDMGFMFMAPIFYLIAGWITINYFFFSIIVVFYRIVIVVGLSLFPMFVLFTVMAVTSKSLDKTTKYFTNYIQEVLIKPTIAIFFLTYVMSFFAMLILELVLGVFSFQVCVKRVFTPPFGLDFVLPTFDYYEAVRPFSKRDVAGTILGFDTSALDLPYINPTTNQVNPNSLEKRGNSDILFSMMILNFILLSLYGILFRKIFGVVIQTAEKLNAAFGGSGLGDGKGGGFKDIMDKASEYGGKAADLASSKIEAAGDAAMAKTGEGLKVMGEASKTAMAKDAEILGRIAGNLKEGASNLGDAAKENFTKAMESLRNNGGEGGGSAGEEAPGAAEGAASEGENKEGTESESTTEAQDNGGAGGTGNAEGAAPGSAAEGGGSTPVGGGAAVGGVAESSATAGAKGAEGEAGRANLEGGFKGEAKGGSSTTQPESTVGGESIEGGGDATGRAGEAESEKEIQKERDIIKKTIRHKQTIETEEMEGGEPSAEESTPAATNAGVSASTAESRALKVDSKSNAEEGGVEGDDSAEGGDDEAIETSESSIDSEAEGELPDTIDSNEGATIAEMDGSSIPESTIEEGGSIEEGIDTSHDTSSSIAEDEANVNMESANPETTNDINSPLGHEGNTALGHEGDSAFEHGANNPVKDDINTPFNVQPSTPQEGGATAFESKIQEVEAIKKGVEKKAALMQKVEDAKKQVEAAKEKKNFLDENVKALSRKEDIAKFRKRSGFLNNQNKDKK